ncbi:MAG: MFS transporter [Candidatus Gastranaerophilales bacterium]|nr:MFS transporter [Candidatus Gastranaerophilales bacterium]
MNIFNYNTRALLGLGFGHFSIEIYASLLVPLYPVITSHLGINLAKISLIIALGHFIASMLQPYFGFISDKLRHRIFMVWGLVVGALFIPFSIKYNNVLFFTTCLLIGMLGNAFFHPQSSTLMKEFNKNNPKIARNMGIFLGLGTIGYALGPYIATYSVENWGLNNLIYLSLIGLVYAIFMYFYVPKMPEREIINKGKFFNILKEILKNKTCMILVFISTVKSLVSICFGTYVPFLLEKYGFALNHIGLIVTLFFISGGIASMTCSKFEKYLKTRGIIAFSMLGILPLCFIFLEFLGHNKVISVISLALIGYFILMSVGIILVQAQKAMPQYTGVISGAIQGVGWGLGALFLPLMGIIGQHFGVDKVMIIASFAAFLTGIFCLKSKSLNF